MIDERVLDRTLHAALRAGGDFAEDAFVDHCGSWVKIGRAHV